jgi:dTDP-4-dehydrorhamnose 3,5-epimerase
MDFRELAVAGAWEVTPVIHRDPRGAFAEWYRADRLTEVVGHPLDLRQANVSVSAKGVLRGVHYASVPPGQAKFVSVTRGAALDFAIDIRVGSPTFGTWEVVELDAESRRSVYLSEGLGHAVYALEDDTTISYLVSAEYAPDREFSINPYDPRLALDLPADTSVSDRDAEAPSLDEALAAGILPSWDVCRAYLAKLDGGD